MATATTRPPASTVNMVTIGVSAPAEFPEDEIRTVLTDAGHSVAFWHEDIDEAVDACRAKGPDLFLLGSRRPDTAALECVRTLAEASKGRRLILICERSGSGDLRKALDAGVSGFVALSEVDSALPPVIEVVRAGQISVPGSRGEELKKKILTSREKQILGLVVMGMTNAEIAGKLFLAESTVKSHLSSSFAKLGVSSRSEAATVILDPQSGSGLGILTIPTTG